MTKQRRSWRLLVVAGAMGLAALACKPGALANTTQLSVTILSPESGSSVEIGETLSVEVMGEDPDGPGVFRLDLQLDGLVVDSFEAAGPQAELGATLEVTPSEEGASTLAAIAYREDGTPSEATTIALSVTAEDVEVAEETSDEEEDEEEAPPAAEDSASEAAAVQASATSDVDILEEPGVGCRVIGEVPRDEVIDLLRRTTSPSDHYYQTNYMGEDKLGWVFNNALTLRADDDDLPRDPEATCLYCGDGTCSADENCGTCTDDCGACAAAAPQPPAPVNQPQTAPGACAAGPSACCGDGTCDGGEDCVACSIDCGVCMGEATVCGEFCSNGVCDPACGENANNCFECNGFCGDGVCETGSEDLVTCQDDCFNPSIFLNVGHCPDGVCDPAAGENAFTCAEDCYDFCGDGFCTSAEYGTSLCPQDCGDTDGGQSEPVCGDGTVAGGEECDPPGAFCAHEHVGSVVIEVECSSDCTCPA